MEKYNKLIRNITELIEKGLFNSKDLKKELEKLLKFKTENIANRLNLVSREEFEVQKKKMQKKKKHLINVKNTKTQKKKNYNGNETLTLRPFIGLFSKLIFPPCERIISLAIDSPNPTPDLF